MEALGCTPRGCSRVANRKWRWRRRWGSPGSVPTTGSTRGRPRTGGAQRRGPRGSEAAIGRRAAGRGGASAAEWPAGARIQHRSVDLAASRRTDRPADPGPTPSGPCLATAPRAGLVPAAADAARAGTGRASDQDLEDSALAAAKKHARRRRAWIVFEDDSGLSQQPVVCRTWAPRGKRPS